MVMLISDKKYFKTKYVKRDKERHNFKIANPSKY